MEVAVANRARRVPPLETTAQMSDQRPRRTLCVWIRTMNFACETVAISLREKLALPPGLVIYARLP